MKWKRLLRDLGISTALALAVSGLFAYVHASSLVLSLAVLLFAGPVTDLLLELIRSRNPGAIEVAASRWVRWASLVWVAFIAVVSLGISHWSHSGYWQTFAATWLIVSGAGAVNAIVAEWEDNKPGGFLNPRKK